MVPLDSLSAMPLKSLLMIHFQLQTILLYVNHPKKKYLFAILYQMNRYRVNLHIQEVLHLFRLAFVFPLNLLRQKYHFRATQYRWYGHSRACLYGHHVNHLDNK